MMKAQNVTEEQLRVWPIKGTRETELGDFCALARSVMLHGALRVQHAVISNDTSDRSLHRESTGLHKSNIEATQFK